MPWWWLLVMFWCVVNGGSEMVALHLFGGVFCIDCDGLFTMVLKNLEKSATELLSRELFEAD
jgi:hypothetical protein